MSGSKLWTVALAGMLMATGSTVHAGPIFPCGIFGLQCRNPSYAGAYVPYGNPVYAPTGGCNTCAPAPAYSSCSPCQAYRPACTTNQYVPRTVYRPTLVTTPRTSYRPVRACDACGQSTVTMVPYTTYYRRLAMVPHTTYYRAYRGYQCAPVCASPCGSTCGSACGSSCSTGSCGGYAASSSCGTGCNSGVSTDASMGVTPQPSLRPSYPQSNPAPNGNSGVIRSESQKTEPNAGESEQEQQPQQESNDQQQPEAEPAKTEAPGPELVDPDARVALVTAVYNADWSRSALRPAVHRVQQTQPVQKAEDPRFGGWHEVRPHPSDR